MPPVVNPHLKPKDKAVAPKPPPRPGVAKPQHGLAQEKFIAATRLEIDHKGKAFFANDD